MRHTLWLRAVLVSGVCLLPLASPASAKGVFVLQLGSFKSESEAQTKGQSVLSQNAALLPGLSLQVTEVTLQPDNYKVYRTQAGPVASRPEAQRICRELKKSGSECFVVESAMFASAPATPVIKTADNRVISAPEPMPEEEPKPVLLEGDVPAVRTSAAALPPSLPAPSSAPEPLRMAEATSTREAPMREAPVREIEATPAPASPTSDASRGSGGMFSWIFPDDEDERPLSASEAPTPREANAEEPARVQAASEERVATLEPAASARPVQTANLEGNRTGDPAMRKRRGGFSPAPANIRTPSWFDTSDSAETPPPTAAETPQVIVPFESERIASPQPVFRAPDRVNEPMQEPLRESVRETVEVRQPEPAPVPMPTYAERNALAPLPPRAMEPMPEFRPEPTPEPVQVAPPAPKAAEPMRAAALERTADGYIRGREPKSLNVSNAPTVAEDASPVVMEPAREGEVNVAEAVRVPVTSNAVRKPVARVTTAQTEAVRYAYPSQNLQVRTLWAQLSTFDDEQSALGYWNNFSAANTDLSSNVRVRVTRPYVSTGRATSGVNLRVGPYGSAAEIRELCERAAQDNVRCVLNTDLGTSGTAGIERARGYGPHDYAMHPRQYATAREMFWVQLGTYPARAEAQDVWSQMQGSNRGLLGRLSSSIAPPPAGSNNRPLYRLRTGPFASSMEASNLCGRLSARGISCLVVTGR